MAVLTRADLCILYAAKSFPALRRLDKSLYALLAGLKAGFNARLA